MEYRKEPTNTINIDGQKYTVSWQGTANHKDFVSLVNYGFELFDPEGTYLSMNQTYGVYPKQFYTITRFGQIFKYVIVVDTFIWNDPNQKNNVGFARDVHIRPPAMQSKKIAINT